MQMQNKNQNTINAVVDGNTLISLDGRPVVNGRIRGGIFDGKSQAELFLPKGRVNIIQKLPPLSKQKLIAEELDSFDFYSELSSHRDNGVLGFATKERLGGTTIWVGKFETPAEIQSRLGFQG